MLCVFEKFIEAVESRRVHFEQALCRVGGSKRRLGLLVGPGSSDGSRRASIRSAREHEINVYLKQDKLNYWELGALVSTFSGCDPVVGAQLFR